MKRVIVLGLLALALALPMAAWADAFDLTNQFGSITISNSGITTKGSELTSYDGIIAPKGHSLGTVSYSTGALLTGSIAGGGTFSAAGFIYRYRQGKLRATEGNDLLGQLRRPH